MSRLVWWIVTLLNLIAGVHGLHELRILCDAWRGILTGLNLTAAAGSALMALAAPARRQLKGTGY